MKRIEQLKEVAKSFNGLQTGTQLAEEEFTIFTREVRVFNQPFRRAPKTIE
ncbi:hypothetical protein [Tepidibacillus fermentans]|uniref:hypothetical protein n=1 Tax=Tepidibacillus fermentans TaxID=1281767 RepID=UPI001404855C|nr:hypothetical protein [Tepidibacillus fermentans]